MRRTLRPRRLASRALAALVITGALLVGGGALFSGVASAHPLGNFTVNRYGGIEVLAGEVRIRYVLDMAEIPTYQTMPSIDTNGDGKVVEAERRAWVAATDATIARGVRVAVDGRALALWPACGELAFRPGQAGAPILRLDTVLQAPAPRDGTLAYADSNWADRVGWREVTATAGDGEAIVTSTAPATSVSDELLRYPADLLSSPLRTSSATVRYRSTRGGAATPPASCARRAPVAAPSAFAELVTWHITPVVLVLSLILAVAFGAIHALGPGHGKTITAAYLVGSGARRRQAFLIGGAVSLMHTASVLVLGVVALVLTHTFAADRVYPWLGLATGLVAIVLGGVLMVTRVRARRGGRDPWGHGHAHPHGDGHASGRDSVRDHECERDHRHEHEHDAGRPALSRRGLAALAVAGGILPSPTALVVLTGALIAHRVAYGLALIVAFSAGLASALMGVGLVALRARSAVSRRFGERTTALIPIASAAVILGFGAFFAVRGIAQVLAG